MRHASGHPSSQHPEAKIPQTKKKLQRNLSSKPPKSKAVLWTAGERPGALSQSIDLGQDCGNRDRKKKKREREVHFLNPRCATALDGNVTAPERGTYMHKNLFYICIHMYVD